MESSWVPEKRAPADEVPEEESEATINNNNQYTGKKFTIDKSKNGRARCKHCRNNIIKDDLRIGKSVLYRDKYILQYYHIKCAFETFKRARSKENTVLRLEDLDGYVSLSDEESENILDLISALKAMQKPDLPDSIKMQRKEKLVQHAGRKVFKPKNSNIPSMKIMFTNADQLTGTKMSELMAKIIQEKPIIVAISEAKLKNSTKERVIEDYQNPNYSLHPANLTNNIGRGMAIYTHTSLDKSVVEIKLGPKFEETVILEIRLRGGDVLLFCCCYRSPTFSETSGENNDKLNKFLKIISTKKYSHRCIIGDFNYRKINWESWTTESNENSPETRFLDTIRDCYFYQHITKPTRARGKDNPTLIDLIFTDEEAQVSNVQYHPPLGKGDHNVIVFDFHCYLDYSKPQERYKFSKANYSQMRAHLNDTKWGEQFTERATTGNMEEVWYFLKSTLSDLKTKYVPISVVTGKPTWSKVYSFPISESAQRAIAEKKRAHRSWIAAIKNGNGEEERAKYTKAVNKVKTEIRRDKRSYEKKIAEGAKVNPKAFWAHARRKLKTKVGIAPLLSDPDNKESLKFGDIEKADILQKQFSSVFTNEPEGNIPRIRDRCMKTDLDFSITEEMVLKLIESLNPNKSIGPDDMHPKMLIELKNDLATPLTYIFNLSLKSGKMPNDWKLANISPIYKKGSQNLAINYRPISLTSIVCKMMEKFVRDRIMNHLKEKNLLSKKQHGFISGRSTVTQLLNYLDKCIDSLTHHVIDTVYLDFAKAFDTVPHRRLLGKLESYGISGTVLHWIREYLNDRSQTVLVNGGKSFVAPVISGIPQGTCLGPLLFVVYINDLLDDITSDGYMFADDTKIFRQISSSQDSKYMQDDIHKLEAWSKLWLLCFHPEKCHILTMGKLENTRHTEKYTICRK